MQGILTVLAGHISNIRAGKKIFCVKKVDNPQFIVIC